MGNIDIVSVTPNDLDQLQKIGRQTFFETFSAGNTAENMNKYLKMPTMFGWAFGRKTQEQSIFIRKMVSLSLISIFLN